MPPTVGRKPQERPDLTGRPEVANPAGARQPEIESHLEMLRTAASFTMLLDAVGDPRVESSAAGAGADAVRREFLRIQDAERSK
jgi:hypothetical protein